LNEGTRISIIGINSRYGWAKMVFSQYATDVNYYHYLHEDEQMERTMNQYYFQERPGHWANYLDQNIPNLIFSVVMTLQNNKIDVAILCSDSWQNIHFNTAQILYNLEVSTTHYHYTFDMGQLHE